jgi:hypothetical protein
MDQRMRGEVEGIDHLVTTEEDVKGAFADLKTTLSPMQMEKVVRRGIAQINGDYRDDDVLTDDLIKAQFSLFDSDGDGEICKKDIEDAIGKSGLDSKNVRELLQSANISSKSTISFEEFERIVRNVDQADQTLIKLVDMKARLSRLEKHIDDRAAKEIFDKRAELKAEISIKVSGFPVCVVVDLYKYLPLYCSPLLLALLNHKEQELEGTRTGFGKLYQTAMARYKSSESVYESITQFIAFMCLDDPLQLRSRMERAGRAVLVPYDCLLHPPRRYRRRHGTASPVRPVTSTATRNIPVVKPKTPSKGVRASEGSRGWEADQTDVHRIFSDLSGAQRVSQHHQPSFHSSLQPRPPSAVESGQTRSGTRGSDRSRSSPRKALATLTSKYLANQPQRHLANQPQRPLAVGDTGDEAVLEEIMQRNEKLRSVSARGERELATRWVGYTCNN